MYIHTHTHTHTHARTCTQNLLYIQYFMDYMCMEKLLSVTKNKGSQTENASRGKLIKMQ